jgi:hypothetical protein
MFVTIVNPELFAKTTSHAAVLEQQLLALGPMPRRGDAAWSSEQWERYARIVRQLAALLSLPPTDHEQPRPALSP